MRDYVTFTASVNSLIDDIDMSLDQSKTLTWSSYYEDRADRICADIHLYSLDKQVQLCVLFSEAYFVAMAKKKPLLDDAALAKSFLSNLYPILGDILRAALASSSSAASDISVPLTMDGETELRLRALWTCIHSVMIKNGHATLSANPNFHLLPSLVNVLLSL
jgi:hypothetical protein